MHSKTDSIEIMINDEADKVLKEIFDLLKYRYQNNSKSVKGSEFIVLHMSENKPESWWIIYRFS